MKRRIQQVDRGPEVARPDRKAAGGGIWQAIGIVVGNWDRSGSGRVPAEPRHSLAPGQISLEWTMCSNWRQRATTRNADPANANQNGAVIPNVLASRPPIGVPITIPPMIATR